MRVLTQIEEVLDKCIREKTPVIYETSNPGSENDGDFWTQTTLTPILDENDSLVRLAAVDSDITRIKVSEQELQESLEKLRKTQKALAEVSHRAGMAEVATTMLHNVGNTLNTVNTTSYLIRDKVRKLNLKRVKDISGLFNEHIGDLPRFFSEDTKGIKLIQLLEKLGDRWIDEQQQLVEYANRQQDSINHIATILAAQEEYTDVVAVLESISLKSIINTAISKSILAKSGDDITLQKELESLPNIRTEPRKLIQILVCLLNHAVQALRDSSTEEKKVILQATKTKTDRIVLSVIDNGIGFTQAQQIRVFSQEEGWELHTAANAATQLGGALTCETDGPDKGAAFHLELPFWTEKTGE